MSEEQNQKKCCCKIALIVLTAISLAFSIAALILSTYALNQPKAAATGGNEQQQEEEAPKVVISKQYDKGQSFEKAQKTGKPILVFFYTDWCGFCQRFAPTYDKIAKSRDIKKNVAVAYVNCEEEANRKIAEEYNIQAFPTVYVVDAKGTRTQLDNGTFFNEDSVEVVSKNVLDLINKK